MTLNSTSIARPPSTANNITTGYARAGGVKHQVKPLLSTISPSRARQCVRVVRVVSCGAGENFHYVFKGARTAPD